MQNVCRGETTRRQKVVRDGRSSRQLPSSAALRPIRRDRLERREVTGGQEVAGSNPVSPTTYSQVRAGSASARTAPPAGEVGGAGHRLRPCDRCADPVHDGHRGSGTWLTVSDAAPVPGRQWLRYLPDSSARLRVHQRPVASFFAVVVRARRSGGGRRVGGVGSGGAALSGRARGAQRRGDGDRCGPPLWGGRQTVHEWLRRYAAHGLAGLVDQSSKPLSCPHQMAPVVEARIVELRREHPGWGPRTIGASAGREGFVPVPGRTSIYRASGPPPADHAAGPQTQAGGLQALGAVAGDGVVADGHRRRGAPRRRHRSEDRVGDR